MYSGDGGGGEIGMVGFSDGGYVDGVGFIDVEIDGDVVVYVLVYLFFGIDWLGYVEGSWDVVECI